MAFILFDEHLGTCHPVGELRSPSTTLTVRDLIRARVELELERAQAQFRPEPSDPVRRLNRHGGLSGFGSAFLNRNLGPEEQADKLVAEAEAAFVAGRYFLLLGDRQAEALDEPLHLGTTGEATFLLITPLQGG